MAALILDLQKKNQSQSQGESSHNAQQNKEQSLVNEGEVQTRSIQLDFSIFNGDDLEGWLYNAKQFFAFHHTSPQHRLQLVSFHVEDKALTWFQDFEESGGMGDWESFVRPYSLG